MYVAFCFVPAGLLFIDTVFVGFTGEDLRVHYELNIPANQSEDTLACFDPYNQMIFKHKVPATQGHAVTKIQGQVEVR